MIKIVHIGTADISGGAARASYAIHRGLLKNGCDSKMLVGYKYSKDPEIEGVWFNRGIVRRGLHHFLIGKLEEYTGLQYLIQPFRNVFLKHRFVRDADIIHLHNIHGNFFSHTILPRLSRMAPIVWTLHDMWPMTGHCGYPELYGCTVWKTGKGKCPALNDYPPIKIDTVEYLWRRKKEIYERSDITIVGPSRWMCRMAHESPLLNKFPIHHIPYGIDHSVFFPQEQNNVRSLLNIPLRARVIMISALPNAPRKGLDYFLKSLRYIKHDPNIWILVIGSRGLVSVNKYAAKFNLREMGYLRSNAQLNNCFGAADIFVLPTLADNLPVTIQEAFSAGVPVVSFDVGGVPDLVRRMKTGYLARYKDEKDLAAGINLLLDSTDLRDGMRKVCREVILREYNLGQQAQRYVKLYKELLNHKK